VAPRAARVFLFLLPGGHPRRRDGEGVAVAAGAAFFPLPFGRPGPRFLGTPSPPRAGAAPIEVAAAGAAAAAAARAAKVFWLRLPFGRPCLRDTGGIVARIAIFFPLPFGRPGPCFSGTPSLPAPGPPGEDIDRLSSDEKIEAGEEVECAIDPERPQYLRRSDAGEGAGVVGSAMPNASVTAPFSSHRAHPQEGYRCDQYSGSWVEPTGCVADARQATPHDVLGSYYGGRKV
jgi:hypothetical protein